MTDNNIADEQLYDVLVPPGVPQKVIIDITKKFKVKVVERKEKLTFANMEGEERNLLAFRGKLEVVQEVEKYMMDQLKAFIEK
jgi:hypothetical protein